MTVKIEEATREQVAVFLPEAIRKTIDSYHAFMEGEIESGGKKFAEHHSAGKVAISHLQLLLKLAQWADVESGVGAAEIASFLEQGKDSANEGRENEFLCNAGKGNECMS